MKYAVTAVSAVAVVGGIVGCSAPPAALGSTTALVTVNGQDAGTKRPIDCQQVGEYWIIETVDKTPGFSATFQTAEGASADSVDIRDLAGFTGSMWKGTIGEADVDIVGNTYVITGKADGSPTNDPTNGSTATFKIQASC